MNAKRFFTITLLTFAIVAVDARLDHSLNGNSFLRGPRGAQLRNALHTLKSKIVARGGCNVDVCFAVDGSSRMSSSDYVFQKQFVELVSTVIATDKHSRVGAVQYGLSLSEVSPLTSNTKSFMTSLSNSKALGGRRAFVAGGLAYCVRQLLGRPRGCRTRSCIAAQRKFPRWGSELFHRTRNVQKRKALVFVGNGRNSFGSGRPSGPLRRLNGEVYAVAAGSPDRKVLAEIADDASRVFVASKYDALGEVAPGLIKQICHLW